MYVCKEKLLFDWYINPTLRLAPHCLIWEAFLFRQGNC